MAGDTKFWSDPRSIEAYCAERTKQLIQYVDELFKDFTATIGEEDGLTPRNTIEAQRHALDRVKVLMRVNNMQAEVFRRSMDRKQDDLKALVEEETNLISLISDQLAFKSLPTLPDEVIAQIFVSLYFMDDLPDHNASTTLQDFLHDRRTSDPWRRLIRREIPGVFTGDGKYDFRQFIASDSDAKEILGPRPRKLPTDDSDALLSGSSMTVFTSVKGWPKLKDKLRDLCKFPWHNLIVSAYQWPDQRANGSLDRRMEIMNYLVQNFGHKLANLERLEVSPYRKDGLFQGHWGPLEVGGFDGRHIFVSKLRAARLPLQLLHDLRPLLSNITELEIGIPCQSKDLTSGFGTFVDYLRPYADTLVDLKLSDSARDNRWKFPFGPPEINVSAPFPDAKGQDRPISFPGLQRLTLDGFVECILLDVLSMFECPSLSDVSISLGWYVPENERRDCRISAASLHEKYPSLRCIDICLPVKDFRIDCNRNIEFFEALTKPDAFGNWLFPRLETIGSNRSLNHSLSLESSMLRTLTRVVIARLSCSATMSIRSVNFPFFNTLPEKEMLDSVHMRTLKLLVPNVTCQKILTVFMSAYGDVPGQLSETEDSDL